MADHGDVAQWLEQPPLKRKVGGSSPPVPTTNIVTARQPTRLPLLHSGIVCLAGRELLKLESVVRFHGPELPHWGNRSLKTWQDLTCSPSLWGCSNRSVIDPEIQGAPAVGVWVTRSLLFVLWEGWRLEVVGPESPPQPFFFLTFRDSQAARQRAVNSPIAGSIPAPGATRRAAGPRKGSTWRPRRVNAGVAPRRSTCFVNRRVGVRFPSPALPFVASLSMPPPRARAESGAGVRMILQGGELRCQRRFGGFDSRHPLHGMEQSGSSLAS